VRSQFGDDGARLAAKSSVAAIAFIERTAAELSISCDFVRVPGFRYCQDPDTARELAKEAETTRSLGLATAYQSNAPLPLSVEGALRFSDQARFDAPRYCQGLARSLPGVVYGDTVVESVTDGEPCTLRAAGYTVTAKTVVQATHVPKWLAPALLEKIIGCVSYTMAFELRTHGIGDGLFWDCEDPYHYIRRVRDQDRELLLIGGADQRLPGSKGTVEGFRVLESYAREHFAPGEVVYRGSGEYFTAADGLPYIGRLPETRHMLVGTGYGGTGLTLGTFAGLLLADQVLGNANEWEELYSPSRAVADTRSRARSTSPRH
jgi:glycine/D-amino acid oxidase-like deaminating enzyme